ncbi:sulfotransferase [Aeoliella sp.]|uniref:sulfotransferase family protein n=1 Tax=Aeoliella sp. TaxID=2795800 RepID=UPI003CCB82BE
MAKTKAANARTLGATSIVRQAQGLLQSQRFEEAIQVLSRARKRFPKHVDVCTALGSAYARLGRFPAAEVAYLDACRLAPHRPDLQRIAGLALQEMGSYQQAELCFRRAAELEPQSASNFAHLAQVLERQHRLDEAQEAFQRALDLDSHSPAANLAAAVIARRNGDLESAENRLVQLLERNPPADIAWKANYELAKVRDRSGCHGDAMEALLAAKRLQEKDPRVPGCVQRAWRHRSRMNESLDELSAEQLERWHSNAPATSDNSPAVLVGHPRSGTTMCLQMLSAHPDVVGLDEKHPMGTVVHNGAVERLGEEESVPECLDRLSNSNIVQLRSAYWREVDRVIGEPLGSRVLIDKHPQYIAYLPSIMRVFGGSKIIFVVRDPRDVCLSCFMQAFSVNATSVSFLTLERTVDHYVQFMSSWRRIRDLLPSGWTEVKYEALARDLPTYSRRITEFLEVPWSEQLLAFHELALHSHSTTPSYEAITRPINTDAIGRWKHYAKEFEPHLEKLRPFVEEYGYST